MTPYDMLRPYRIVFASGSEVIQFHLNPVDACKRAEALLASYGSADYTVSLDRGFYPQPAGHRAFLHAKEVR